MLPLSEFAHERAWAKASFRLGPPPDAQGAHEFNETVKRCLAPQPGSNWPGGVALVASNPHDGGQFFGHLLMLPASRVREGGVTVFFFVCASLASAVEVGEQNGGPLVRRWEGRVKSVLQQRKVSWQELRGEMKFGQWPIGQYKL